MPPNSLVLNGDSVFEQAMCEHPGRTASLEKDGFPRLLEQGMYAKEQRGVFVDIGTPDDYRVLLHKATLRSRPSAAPYHTALLAL
jgi:NDP-sugar pyrophosphorylase family protein